MTKPVHTHPVNPPALRSRCRTLECVLWIGYSRGGDKCSSTLVTTRIWRIIPPPTTFKLTFDPLAPSPVNASLCILLSQNMSRDKNLVSEIDITNNRYTVPTLGDLLSNDTNDFALLRNLLAVSSVQSTCQAEFWGRINCYTGNLWLQKDVGSFEWRNAMCLWDRKAIFVHNFSACQYIIASNFTVSLHTLSRAWDLTGGSPSTGKTWAGYAGRKLLRQSTR